jgi:hypothetical protein
MGRSKESYEISKGFAISYIILRRNSPKALCEKKLETINIFFRFTSRDITVVTYAQRTLPASVLVEGRRLNDRRVVSIFV